MTSVRMDLPASVHFFCSAARLVLSRSLLSFASSSNTIPGNWSPVPLQPFCVMAKVNCPCGSAAKSASFKPRSFSSGATNVSFHLPMNLSWNGFMAGSFHNSNCGDWCSAVRSAAESGTVTTNNVSAGRRFSAGGIAARREAGQGQRIAANAARNNGRRIFVIMN